MNECGFCRGWTVKNGIKVCLTDRWILYKWKFEINKQGYPQTKYGKMFLHYLIYPNQESIHHKNKDKLDNRQCNLDGMTKSEHAKLHGKNKYKQYKYPGACFNKRNNPEKKCWMSQITYKNKVKFLGTFEDPITASIVYKLIKEEVNAISK